MNFIYFELLIEMTNDAPSDPIFKELHIINFDDIHSVELGKFMYSYKNSLLPSKFIKECIHS